MLGASSLRNRLLLAVSGTAAAVLLTACGGSSDTGPQSAGTTAPPAAASPTVAATSPTAAAMTVTAKETDFAVSLSRTTFTPGRYTFKAENAGAVKHSLEIEGPGLEEETTLLNPGEKGEVTVTLQKGKYEVYCPVGNHKALGMVTEITVR